MQLLVAALLHFLLLADLKNPLRHELNCHSLIDKLFIGLYRLPVYCFYARR